MISTEVVQANGS